ncbi:MAG: PaaI family thioesterase [Deltaproteobacteria bacterium]|nr:PaaI family thioesterase [Deltaproteobacteria bacterium]
MSKTDDTLDRIAIYREQLANAPGTWPAKRALADAIRNLMACLCATDAPEEELLAIAAQVQASAERFHSQPRMVDLPGVAEGSLAGGMEMFMDRSPILGRSNPLAPPVTLDPDHASQLVHGSVYFGRAYEGAPGCVHGGYVAAAFDEALGMACVFSGVPGMTGEITVRYRKPTPLETPLRLEARFDRQEGRKIYNSGELYAGELLVAESTGIFISIDRTKFESLRKAQLSRQAESGKRQP